MVKLAFGFSNYGVALGGGTVKAWRLGRDGNLSSLKTRLFDEIEDGGFRYDMKYTKVGDTGDFILIDTKNYASLASIFKGANINQLKAYLSAITSMNKLKIIQANRSAFGANTALSTLRKNLQKVYRDNESDFLNAIYNNINLRIEIFGSSAIELIDAAPIFNSKLNINLNTSTNGLYNFIEIKTL